MSISCKKNQKLNPTSTLLNRIAEKTGVFHEGKPRKSLIYIERCFQNPFVVPQNIFVLAFILFIIFIACSSAKSTDGTQPWYADNTRRTIKNTGEPH
jgi:hypothetical protein